MDFGNYLVRITDVLQTESVEIIGSQCHDLWSVTEVELRLSLTEFKYIVLTIV